jgi:hypothetical protein
VHKVLSPGEFRDIIIRAKGNFHIKPVELVVATEATVDKVKFSWKQIAKISCWQRTDPRVVLGEQCSAVQCSAVQCSAVQCSAEDGSMGSTRGA